MLEAVLRDTRKSGCGRPRLQFRKHDQAAEYELLIRISFFQDMSSHVVLGMLRSKIIDRLGKMPRANRYRRRECDKFTSKRTQPFLKSLGRWVGWLKLHSPHHSPVDAGQVFRLDF